MLRSRESLRKEEEDEHVVLGVLGGKVEFKEEEQVI